MSELTQKKCLPCEGGVAPLTESKIQTFMEKIPGWEYDSSVPCIRRKFTFKNYYETMAFVNALAWYAHSENHHPDLEVCYGHCVVSYHTHAISGLSENDFICAAKANALLEA